MPDVILIEENGSRLEGGDTDIARMRLIIRRTVDGVAVLNGGWAGDIYIKSKNFVFDSRAFYTRAGHVLRWGLPSLCACTPMYCLLGLANRYLTSHRK